MRAINYTIYNTEDAKENPLLVVFHYNRVINRVTLVVHFSETLVRLMDPPYLDLKFSPRLPYMLDHDGKELRSSRLNPYSRKDNKVEGIHVATGPPDLRAGLYGLYSMYASSNRYPFGAGLAWWGAPQI